MQSGPLRRPERRAAMVRIASERILIDDDSERTPLRAIARAYGLSSGRVYEYEQQLLERTGRMMREDPQVPLLVAYAQRDARGFDAPLDAECLEALERVELRAFRRRFDAMDEAARAQVLYRLIRASSQRVEEVAVNLYRLTGGVLV